jgi:hypothetical protein
VILLCLFVGGTKKIGDGDGDDSPKAKGLAP